MSMFRGVTKLVLGVGFAGACSGYTLHMLTGSQDNKTVQASSALGDGKLFDYLVRNPHEFNPNIPKTSWDFDWDKRDPASFVPPTRGPLESGDEIKRQASLQARPTATRHLLLIRHGQYNLSGSTDEEKSLTPLGWEQAEFTAQRLKALGTPYTRIIQSSMTRARNTASVISKHLPEVPIETCDFLREGAPIMPAPDTPNWRQDASKFHEDGARIEAAFRRYFHRAEPSQTEDSYEILACHANVIRYFVCRALQFPPEAWARFSLHNCSITWIAIRPSGRVTVYSVGDIGHLPPHVLTTT